MQDANSGNGFRPDDPPADLADYEEYFAAALDVCGLDQGRSYIQEILRDLPKNRIVGAQQDTTVALQMLLMLRAAMVEGMGITVDSDADDERDGSDEFEFQDYLWRQSEEFDDRHNTYEDRDSVSTFRQERIARSSKPEGWSYRPKRSAKPEHVYASNLGLLITGVVTKYEGGEFPEVTKGRIRDVVTVIHDLRERMIQRFQQDLEGMEEI